MEVELGNVLTFSHLISLIGEISQVMISSFGVNGKAILISQKSPRQITVTKVLCIKPSDLPWVLAVYRVQFNTKLHPVKIDCSEFEKEIIIKHGQGTCP